MSEERPARDGGRDRSRPPQEEQEERRRRVLTHGTPSITRSIADAVVVKDGSLFFLTEPDGRVPLDSGHGFGLYYHDCRYLNGYELRLAGARPERMVSTAESGYMAVLQLANPDLRLDDGRLVPKEDIGVRWERLVDGDGLALQDLLVFHNYSLRRVEVPVTLEFRAEFEDIFAVREFVEERPGELHPPTWRDGALHFLYSGADELHRALSIHFSPQPDEVDGATVRFRLPVEPQRDERLSIALVVAESSDRSEVRPQPRRRPDPERVAAARKRSTDDWVRRYARVHSDSMILNRMVERSFRDLGMLHTTIGEESFFAAGVPWFVTLFGRDSIITALQTLAFDPDSAVETLRVLANHQGRRVDDWTDEQPGKILHELRIGELTRVGEVPYTPYYGTVDATPLFLVLLARHAAWTGDLSLFHELRDHVGRALDWITEHGDREGDGYVEYRSDSEKGLINQGWKDSGDAIVNADGRLADPPIALVEVQGYVYLAKRSIAGLFRRAGEDERAGRLEQEAAALRARFDRDFWMEDEGIYALALQADKTQAAVVSSNPGHALWTGIAEAEKARRTVERLMAEDMYTGWGIRTLSSREARYNPLGYHLGTVWPHDNSIIAVGCRRYGFDEAARHIARGLLEAAVRFEHFRLPELFGGFRRADFGVPVHYPVANHPQAWGAGSVPYLLEGLLGLVPEAFERRLRIVRPLLPDLVRYLEIRRLRVGDARVDLRFERSPDGIAIQVLDLEGELDIVIEPERRTR